MMAIDNYAMMPALQVCLRQPRSISTHTPRTLRPVEHLTQTVHGRPLQQHALPNAHALATSSTSKLSNPFFRLPHRLRRIILCMQSPQTLPCYAGIACLDPGSDRKSRRYGMAPEQIPVFLSQKPSTENGQFCVSGLRIAWV